MPRHVNPTSPHRTATAPYNFVPLPERVFEIADGIGAEGQKIKPWEMHDCFVPDTYSGCIELTIETLTPLYIRGAVVRKEDGGWDNRDSRLRPDSYMTPDGRPAIPGSSLRGMVRTLVEILSFSKIQPVSEAEPFFRSVAPDRIGRLYGERLRRGNGVQAGFAVHEGSDWAIRRCEMLRVERSLLPQDLHDDTFPRWKHQHKRCWVEASNGQVTRIEFREQGNGSWAAGTLVLTGDVPRKRREFVFLDPDEGRAPTQIPEAIWRRFHDDDQITQWQERAFPLGQPPGAMRPAPGHLPDGEPVFFALDDRLKSDDNPDGLVFFGRAGMFRFPYDSSPADMVPRRLREARLDLAEAMFGKVDRSAAIKGRVYFEDAVATNGGSTWYESELVPQILSAPKPTTFQHYLTQDGTRGKDQLTTYLAGDHTTIRGHKLYWHRWKESDGISQVRETKNHDSLLQDLGQVNPQDRQHTKIRPVKAGVTFAGRIRFENLTELEFGALLHALELPDGCCHRIGMGKPLGLGSIRITARVKVVDRAVRYRTWQSSGVQTEEDGHHFRKVFVEAMFEHARTSQEVLLNDQEGLRQIARLDVLFQLLTWGDRPASASTAYMELPRFRDRPVLPTPHAVRGVDEPPWRRDAPQPASGAGGAPGRRDQPDRTQGRRGHAPREANPQPRPAVPAPIKPKPIEKGQTRRGTLKRSGGGWVAVFEGDPREARIINPDKISAECSDEETAEFYIIEQSKKGGIKCRFEAVRPRDEKR